MVAVLVDYPYEPQFLPDMVVAQSASIAAGRATCQAQPLTQNGEILGSLQLEVPGKRLLPRGYGDNYSVAVLDQLKAWEAFRSLHLCWRENHSMPTGDFTPAGCPRAGFHGQLSRELTRHPVVTARVAEATCRS